ncbi:conserved hypothetical protein [Trichophyton verrucosum HKI 0517]|uniref:C2 NT-type domain-containing protein n=1 Tax=Trichophyton verrucosum (strain HKI 0517) TaxID=663202 RepID=D4DEH4_TRIVH|nr:uncharacterized protein TRV_05541 [Trichophyton verrucosum HKI 0517]EFE39752.1 conserved hypothetical protein [Trichophyton verrucosum HKI 0517]
MINVPLVVGTAYVKWQLPSSASADHNGHTEKALLHDHRASWDYEKLTVVRLTVDRNQMLQDCELQLDIFQEFTAENRADRVPLGNIKLNLSEYVDKTESDEGITRRYLMQNSKINATVKVGIAISQIEGDSNFTAPPLKPATVFSGIAGVMSTEHGEINNDGHIPSVNNRGREYSDLQDMYRSTLAAAWATLPDELPPDQLIENIFAGGDGFPQNHSRYKADDEDEVHDNNSLSDAGSHRTIRDSKNSPDHIPRIKDPFTAHSRSDSRHSDFSFGAVGKERNETGAFERSGGKRRKRKTLTEFDYREDLRSWEVSWAKEDSQR